MDEKADRWPCLLISQEKADGIYPIYFGISCAFVALKLLSRSDIHNAQIKETQEKLLHGSAHLLGLLVWRIQTREAQGRSEFLHRLETEVAKLKRRRSEDAKANHKVVSIFTRKEQDWLTEKRKLHRVFTKEFRNKEGIISNLYNKMQDKDLLLHFRDKTLEAEEDKRKELEDKLHKSEAIIAQMKETRNKEIEQHGSELWKHKTAFAELVSNQQQLEAEMERALHQVEAAKHELDTVFKHKEDSVTMVQKLSVEVIKLRKESEQKEKILSVMLRKSKLDTAEKEILFKELKISKAKKKQVKLEIDRLGAFFEFNHESNKRRNFANKVEPDMFRRGKEKHLTTEAGSSQTRSQPRGNMIKHKPLLLDYLETQHRKEPKRTVNMNSEGGNFVMTMNVEMSESRLHMEIDKNIMILSQRHRIEIDAFAEQLRLKDERLEAFQWRLLSVELESKQLESHIKDLDQRQTRVREENMKLESLLLNREAELKSLKEKFINTPCQLMDQNPVKKIFGPEPKMIKAKLSAGEEAKPASIRKMGMDKEAKITLEGQSQYATSTVQAPEKEIEVEKEVVMDRVHVIEKCTYSEEAEVTSVGHCLLKKDTKPWKMDLHALGVSYNIKRLNQQLLLLDKLAGMPRSCEGREADYRYLGVKGFVLLMSLLNKQVGRYQALQEKINDICERMQKNGLHGSSCDSRIARTKEEIKTLQSFLEETFQQQRYMVATGQKLKEIQSRITSGFVEGTKEGNRSERFDTGRFADTVRTFFKEVHRGLEVRISRLIGDLEGTLASDSIMHVRNKCQITTVHSDIR